MSGKELGDVARERLGLCSCGDPIAVMEKVRDVLAASEYGKGQQRFDLVGGNTPDGWFWLYVMQAAGFLEHGTSCRSSWRTNRGDRFLEALELHGTDPDKWESADDIAPDMGDDGIGRCSTDCPQYQSNQDHTCCALGEWKKHYQLHEDPATNMGEVPPAICPVWVRRGRDVLLLQIAKREK